MDTKQDVIAALDSAGLEYSIVDAENPENNQVIPTARLNAGVDPLRDREKSREDAFQRVAHNVRLKLAESINNRREAENKRAMRARIAKGRAKARLAKASRKRNRG